MPTTTTLNEYDLQNATTNKEINELLDEIRKRTGEDWQVIESERTKSKGFFTVSYQRFDLFVYVGGVLPWQHIISGSGGDSSTTIGYLYGMLNGMDRSSKPRLVDNEQRRLADIGNEIHNLSCEIHHTNEQWADQLGGLASELWDWDDNKIKARGIWEAHRHVLNLMEGPVTGPHAFVFGGFGNYAHYLENGW